MAPDKTKIAKKPTEIVAQAPINPQRTRQQTTSSTTPTMTELLEGLKGFFAPQFDTMNQNILAVSNTVYSRLQTMETSVQNLEHELSSSHTNSTDTSPLIASKWKQFWRLRISLNARNTWYRFLHRKVATRQLLHQRQSDGFTPFCQICRLRGRYRRHANPPTENLQHFIFNCTKKLMVWKKAISNLPTLICSNSLTSSTFARQLNDPLQLHSHNSQHTKCLHAFSRLSGPLTIDSFLMYC